MTAPTSTPLSGALPLVAAGTTLWLLPAGAVWWPAEHTLFVADLHLGKGAAFRAQGQPLPTGHSADTLARLDALAQAQGAARLVVLGDFWHGAPGLTPSLLDEVTAFARRWPTVLVLGNHDRPIHPGGLGVQVHSPQWTCAPLIAAHEPPSPDAAGFTLAGHLHPALALTSRAGDRLRRPCFLHVANALVLPAFGGLTGSMTLKPADLRHRAARAAVIGAGVVNWVEPPR